MRIFINGTPAEALTPKRKAQIILKARTLTPARVLSIDEATHRLENFARVFFIALAGVSALLIGGLLAVTVATSDLREKPIIFASAIAAAIAVFAALTFGGRRMRRNWLARLDERLEWLPPAGSVVRADDAGLLIDRQLSSWSQLRIDSLWLLEQRDAEGGLTGFDIERLTLLGSGLSTALDTQMMENGQAVVDEVYKRLRSAA